MKKTILLILALFSFYFSLFTQTIGTGQLTITLNDSNTGVTVSSIQNGNTEILNLTNNELFSLDFRNLSNGNATATISSSSNWGATDVVLSNGNTYCTITLSNPNLANIPTTLTATVTIQVTGSQSQWDLAITGVGNNHSLMDASFPHINILGNGGQFLIPRYAGQLIANPAGGINYTGLYPRGNETNMQFLAYYNGGAGVYFGFHDPNAATKTFLVNNESGGVDIECRFPVPNKTLAGNDWNHPGHFALNLFSGNWYDAAMIYKDWASNNADYWPVMTAERQARQAEIGKIGVWFNDIGYYNGNARTATAIQTGTQKCIDYMPGIPIANHLKTWWGAPFDDNYPEILNAIPDLNTSLATLYGNGAITSTYFNGLLYDMDLPSYDATAFPNATKFEDVEIVHQQHYDNSDEVTQFFAVMCPSTPTWQNIVRDAAMYMTNTLNAHAVYIDQISAAGAIECMDPTHNHTLGGGTFWRHGYKTLLTNVRASIPSDCFVSVEGGCDYMLDQVDGLLVDPWDKANMVPAYNAVYAGSVQLYGTKTGTGSYNDPSFYAQLAQTFSFGIQPGRFTTYIMDDPNSQASAKPYVKQLGTMRFKLHEFMSFGEMKRPPSVTPINPATIPTITSNWGTGNVTISALQTSLWQNDEGIAFVFANASMDDALEFSFDVTGTSYGLNGDLKIREVTETSDGTWADQSNSFSQTVTLQPKEIKAFIIIPANALPVTMIQNSFSGRTKDSGVLLTWKTTQEENFFGFDIERSQDGIHWQKIGTIPGKGNQSTTNNYSTYDREPFAGNNYYRLKQIDLDGSFVYSKIITVHFKKRTISIYPNPAIDRLFINSDGLPIDKVVLYNQLGQLSFSSNTPTYELDISALPKGIYTIMIQSKAQVFKQLIVLR